MKADDIHVREEEVPNPSQVIIEDESVFKHSSESVFDVLGGIQKAEEGQTVPNSPTPPSYTGADGTNDYVGQNVAEVGSQLSVSGTHTTGVSCSHDESSVDEESGEPKKRHHLFDFLWERHFWIIFFHGQVLALCLVATNTFSSKLANGGVSVPAFQSFVNYCLLNLVFTSYTIYRYGFKKWFNLLWRDGWRFFILAFADVQGNYFVVKAFAYTNLLSAQLLNCWAVVMVCILSFFFLKVRYRWAQLVGIVVCIAGLVLVVVSDVLTDKDYEAKDMVKGDIFVIIGASCYGISNTFEEYLVSERPIYEVIGQLGFWAMFINGVQCAIFDRQSMAEAQWNGEMGGWFAGFTLVMFVIYTTAPILFRMSSAAFYNIGILTNNFWGLLIGIKVFGYTVFWLYPVGFVFIIIGQVVYFILPGTVQHEHNKPWLGENQERGVVGVGTAKKKATTVEAEPGATSGSSSGDDSDIVEHEVVEIPQKV